MLINVPKWRNNEITEKALVYIEQNYDFAVYPEQYGANIVLANKWLELNPLWNYFATTNKKTPYNIHFVDRKPIYSTYKNNPAFRQLFNLYLNQTAWQYFKPNGEIKRILKKANNVLDKTIKDVLRRFAFKSKKQSL